MRTQIVTWSNTYTVSPVDAEASAPGEDELPKTDAEPSPPAALEAGIDGANEFEVEGQLLTDVAGTLDASVLSTPAMIAMMERTASMLVYPLLPAGKATVGFEVCVKHVRAAPEGSRCTARARLDELDGRKLRFSVEVVDGNGQTIGVGSHERRMIDVSGA